jgi:mRNA interferase MazF
MVIGQGDVFWAALRPPLGSEPGFRRPVVVVQNDAFNQSQLRTVVVCALTSNMNLANSPGNVLLGKGEANLPDRSVANITQIVAVDKSKLLAKIGTLSRDRLGQILAGIDSLLRPSRS